MNSKMIRTTEKGAHYTGYTVLCALYKLRCYSTMKLYCTTELSGAATSTYITGGCRQHYGSYIDYIVLCIQWNFSWWIRQWVILDHPPFRHQLISAPYFFSEGGARVYNVLYKEKLTREDVGEVLKKEYPRMSHYPRNPTILYLFHGHRNPSLSFWNERSLLHAFS
jgi:hypothetical protein